MLGPWEQALQDTGADLSWTSFVLDTSRNSASPQVPELGQDASECLGLLSPTVQGCLWTGECIHPEREKPQKRTKIKYLGMHLAKCIPDWNWEEKCI